mgnify:CR=1 FL=1
MNRATMSLLAVVVMLLGGVLNPARAGILAPDGTYAGRTYNDWNILSWQVAYATPIVGGDHPYFSGGSLGTFDGVSLLAVPVGLVDDALTVDLTIQEGTALFIPVIGVSSSVWEAPPFHGDDEASLQANSQAILDQATGILAEIDGVSVDITPFRFVTPLFSWGPLPADNVVGAPEGTISDAAAAGYYLLVLPPAVGEHTIRVAAALGGDFEGFGFNTTFRIQVVPEPASVTILASGVIGLLGVVGVRRARRGTRS